MPTAAAKPACPADLYALRSIEANPSMAVPFILMASCLYYEDDISVLSDGFFDWLCKWALERWDAIDHFHKPLISEEDLRAGTGYAFQYPERVKGAAWNFHTMFPTQPTRRSPFSKRKGRKATTA